MSVCLPLLQNHGGATFGPQAINVTCTSKSVMDPTPPPFSINEDGLLGRKVSYLYERIQTRVFGNVVISGLQLGSLSLDRERTLSSYNMCSGSTVTATLVAKKRQIYNPTIYLYPPVSLADISVKLTLVPACHWGLGFSAVHPPQGMSLFSLGRSFTWKVAAEPNGTLVEKTTGMEVSYLHWEA